MTAVGGCLSVPRGQRRSISEKSVLGNQQKSTGGVSETERYNQAMTAPTSRGQGKTDGKSMQGMQMT